MGCRPPAALGAQLAGIWGEPPASSPGRSAGGDMRGAAGQQTWELELSWLVYREPPSKVSICCLDLEFVSAVWIWSLYL